jgi:MFS-type transporter involved in bile tolerance (Atg22 family)
MTDPLKACHVSFGGDGEGIPVSAMVLYVEALSFFLQFVLFTTIGTLADFGQMNYWIIVASTILLLGTEFAPLALMDDDGSLWYVISLIVLLALIGFNTAAIFYSAAYPLIR